MSEFARKEKLKLEKKKSSLRNFGSNLNVESEVARNIQNDNSPAFGRRERILSEEYSPQ